MEEPVHSSIHSCFGFEIALKPSEFCIRVHGAAYEDELRHGLPIKIGSIGVGALALLLPIVILVSIDKNRHENN